MASANDPTQQLMGNFERISPVFYYEFNDVYPEFPEWTIEKMPKKVNTNRLQLNNQNMSRDGWFYQSYNTQGKFCCLRCKNDDAIWTSAYTTVLFRVYYGPDTDENGDTWFGGWIQMKFFAQQCRHCNTYVTCVLENDRIRLLVKWLHQLIANRFYGFPYRRSGGYRGKNRSLEKHYENLCEACQAGWCSYQRQRPIR